MPKDSTELLDKLDTNKTNIFTKDNLSEKQKNKTKTQLQQPHLQTQPHLHTQTQLQQPHLQTQPHLHTQTQPQTQSKLKLKYDKKKAGKIINKKYCANYKLNYLDKHNKALYNACKINQYCRKTKCKDIDRKFDKIKNNKLGTNGNILLMSSITSSCPIEMSNKSRKKCVNKATKRFYEENNMNDIYNQVLECDKKICAKERQIFFTNLFLANKTKKRIKNPVQVSLEDIPDQQMIEHN